MCVLAWVCVCACVLVCLICLEHLGSIKLESVHQPEEREKKKLHSDGFPSSSPRLMRDSSREMKTYGEKESQQHGSRKKVKVEPQQAGADMKLRQACHIYLRG